jgi:hypothetical protein
MQDIHMYRKYCDHHAPALGYACAFMLIGKVQMLIRRLLRSTSVY